MVSKRFALWSQKATKAQIYRALRNVLRKGDLDCDDPAASTPLACAAGSPTRIGLATRG